MTRTIDKTGAPVTVKADKRRSSKAPLSVGSMRNQCGACGLLFGGLTGFDRHRTGAFSAAGAAGVNRRCMTPQELEPAGMTQGGDGFWRLPAPQMAAA